MNCAFVCLLLGAGLFLACASAAADSPLVLNLWPGKVPGDSGIGQYGPIGQERVRDPNDAPTKTAKWITRVTKPTITVFHPAPEQNTGCAFIVCPGGGYWNLAWDLEGTEVAEWLQSAGITGIVLKYRVPRRLGEPEKLPAHGPLLDAQRAISLVRSKAKEWGIDPSHIGIGGILGRRASCPGDRHQIRQQILRAGRRRRQDRAAARTSRSPRTRATWRTKRPGS